MSDPEIETKVQADKGRKGLSISINLNSILTALVGLIVCGMWTDIHSAHDDLIQLKSQLPDIVRRVSNIEGYIWPPRQTAANRQPPTQDN